MVNTGWFLLVLTVLFGAGSLCDAEVFVVDEYNQNNDPFLYKLTHGNDDADDDDDLGGKVIVSSKTTVTLGDHNLPYNVLFESQKNRIFVNCVSLVIIICSIMVIAVLTVCCYRRRIFKINNNRICRRSRLRFDDNLPGAVMSSSISSTFSFDSNDYKPLDDSINQQQQQQPKQQQQQKTLNKKALRLTLPSQFTNNDYMNAINNSKYVNLSNFSSSPQESPVNTSPPAYDRIINECKMSKKIHLKLHKIINSTINNKEVKQFQYDKQEQQETQKQVSQQEQQEQQQISTKPKTPSKTPRISFRTRLTKIEEEIGKDSQFETINQDLPTYNQYMDKRI